MSEDRVTTWNLCKDAEPHWTSDGFWYDLTDGGYLKFEDYVDDAPQIEELRSAIDAGVAAEIADEMGDVLYSCVNVSRHLGLDAESMLRRSTSKFEKRFRRMEAAAKQGGREIIDMNDDQLDELWELAKGS